MHPRTVELEEHLALSRRILNDAVEQVPADMRERKPAEKRWSVAENLEHLSLVELRLARALTQMIERAKHEKVPEDTDTSSVLSRIDVNRMIDRSRRLDAAESAQPSRGLSADAAWRELEQSRRELVLAVRSGDGIDLFQVETEHPVFGPISAYAWIVFAGAHEQRHALQIHEIADTFNAES